MLNALDIIGKISMIDPHEDVQKAFWYLNNEKGLDTSSPMKWSYFFLEVLVQILLSVCICLARSFVDSSGQDRGPNFRSGGCLSG